MPAEVEVGQIVRLGKVTKAQKDEIIEKMNSLRKRALAGEDFAKLAKDNSEDFGSAKQGGDLGYAKRGAMVAPFEAAALALQPGQLSGIVESEFGFHLIKLNDIRGQEYRAQHILVRPDNLRMDMAEATRFLDSLKVLIQRDSLKFEKAAKEYSQDKPTADANGFMLDPQTRSTRLPFDQSMETNLYFTLDTMKVGTFSQVLPYRTEEEKSAMRIIYYKAKYSSHVASLEQDYQKLLNAALARKRNTAIDKWFDKAKGDVYIYVAEEYRDPEILRLITGSGGN
jgi:peptidyl-prolyl cis-trans isomerase SurA